MDVVGPKKTLTGVSILGPVRSATQIELSLTDARSIGVSAPIRESGDVAGSAPCKLVGPKGEVTLSEGVIAAKRHIHMTTADAAAMGLRDKDVVSVRVPSANGRALTFGDVVVRVSDKFALAMHIDTDESNAAAWPRHHGRNPEITGRTSQRPPGITGRPLFLFFIGSPSAAVREFFGNAIQPILVFPEKYRRIR